jgi:ketosteroid isomerase-like protein
MMRTLLIGVLLLATILITATPDRAENTSADKSMILALESAWNQAELHHDANAVAAIMADTFISVDHHGKLLNKAQYLAELKDLSFKPEEISNSETSVYLYGDVAIVSSAYRTRGTDGGKPFVHRGRFTDTWVKRNGKWECVADHETLID